HRDLLSFPTRRSSDLAGSVAGEELANPKFHPFLAKCEELGVLVFMHPLGTRELEPSGRLAGSGLLTNTIGNPLETTIALSHLIRSEEHTSELSHQIIS